MNELKPCPFCGCEAELEEHARKIGKRFFEVHCPNNSCRVVVRTSNMETREDAVELWNKRR